MRLAQFVLAAVFSAATVLPVMAQTAATPTTPAPKTATTAAPAPAAAAKPATPTPSPVAAKPAVTTPININTATSAQLDSLPGIGPVRAGKIISNRPYKSLEELVSKKAIGEKEFEKIKDKITL
jgi:competence protein ComEA